MWKVIERVFHFLIYRILKLNLSYEKYQVLIQFIKFGLVGLSNTLISYIVYLIILWLCSKTGFFGSKDYIIAIIVSFILSVLWSFYWNKKYVFYLDVGFRSTLLALLKTYVSYSFSGLFLSSVLAVFWVEIIGVSKLISPILNLLISVPINFVLNKFWAFKKSKS